MFSALMFILKVIGLTIVICGSIKKAMNVWAIKRNPRWPVSLFVNSVSEKKLFCGSLFSPILAILYIVFFYTFLYHFFEVIYSWFNQLAGLAHQSIAGLSTPFLQNILNSLVNWIMSPVNFVLLLNLITIWIFIFLKRIYIPIFDRLFRKIELQNSGIIELFFVFREDTKKWFLRNRFLFVRKMYQIVYVFVALGLMFYFASEMSNSDSALQFVGFYPVLILIALEEILYFLGSPSQDEKEEFYGEDDYSNRIVNYDSLRNVFQKIFPSRIVSNEVIQSSKDSQSSFDILDRFSQSENKYEKLAGIYYSGLKQSGKNLNVNYLLMSDNIMLKKNVLVANPFYRDLTEYVLFPIYLRLLEKENILVVLGSDSSEKDFRDWLSNGFEEISHIPNLWRIENINQDTMDNYEIGILRFSELYNSGIIEANKSFFDSVGLILLVNPSQILATGQIGLNVVAELCNTGKIKSSIVAIDSLRDGLVDSLSHVLQQEFVEVFAPSLPTSSSSELIWRSETNSENDNMQAKILPSISRYLGMGTEIATTAIKNQVSEVDWFANEQFPVTDMKWIAGQYYPAITEYAEIDQTQEALSLHLNAKADMWSAVQKNNSFTIVEDEISNAYQIINLFKCRGIEQNFINVISHNYLLRSYMIANQKIFINDNKAIPAITSDFVRSERNLTYKIAFKMMSGYVLDSQIEKELDIYGVKYLSEKGVDKILELFEKYFKIEKNEITDEK
ncbi:MAG: hypothetical protein LBM13_01470 [Candidatus Ancillula sp.]|jgi:hypothetical protein|nr:hypothetical protein [Candidatus Ancillula sp.]